MIKRQTYVDKIKKYFDVPLVKILSGVRRCGKSTILEMVKEELLSQGVSEENIISRRYSNVEFDGMTTKEMYSDLKQAIGGKGRCHLLLDEVQEIDGWERVVNTLQEEENVDLFVTGSNSRLLSSEISTYLTGRYVSIPVYTLSFQEFLDFKNSNKSKREMFEEYLTLGGFPIVASNDFDAQTAYQVVEDIYGSVITKDVSKRHQIRNAELFDRVVRYIIENAGKTFSASTIANFMKNDKRVVSIEAIYNYIKWLSEAFIIYPCQRFDLQGKQVLKTQEKYYLSDISLKFAQLGFDSKMISAALENIVFLEMKRREYDVYVGKNYSKEIDFVGVKRGERVYVQVCRNLPEESNREIENLKAINDHYHKYVVCMDNLAVGNDNGIEIMHIADFLLKTEW